ncbi:MAG: penicillin-binding transpeptidase domain-containing protein [Desulfosarcinaceae bacterium]|nr:penicillin-binding transpeptidase domain-containing protein [Desulfosarcinaceae bacterium]
MRSLRPSWREYQTTLQRRRARSRFMNICLRLGAVAAVITASAYGLLTGLAGSGCQASHSSKAVATAPAAPPAPVESAAATPNATTEKSPPPTSAPPPSRPIATEGTLTKMELQPIMGTVNFTNLNRRMVFFKVDGKPYYAETHLDIALQKRLLESMDRKNSRHIGIVALEPHSGRVVTMASFDKSEAPLDPCLSDAYPAASLFKIVSAVAAAEKMGYRAGTVLKYNGYAHTLYKKQLKETDNKYTNRISFQNAFAKSVNPVFGKIGALYLKGEALTRYAESMGFNSPMPFELPLPPSQYTSSEVPYRWAELASGFNRETTISPLHAAVIAGAMVNDGQMIEPTLIEAVRNEKQALVYRSEPRIWAQVMGPDTVATLSRLMETTIRSGTGRKVFRNQRRDKVLSKLVIGGKTGSIFNRAHDARFDWFAGYAHEKGGAASLAVAVVVAHEEFIGRRAGEYARIAFRHYFEEHFARKEKAGDQKSAS